jgi:hypothetical protein
MSFFTKNRVRNWLLVFLLVTNVATISTILYHSWKFKQWASREDTHYRLKKLIDEDLKFSTEQNEKLKADKEKTKAKKEALYDEFEGYRVVIYNELSKSDIDTSMIDSLVVLTGINAAELNKISIMQYYSIFKLCNAEQKTKLSKFFKDMANEIVTEMKEEKENPDHDKD